MIIKNIIKKLIYIYKICISPYMNNNCRFVETCSTYAINVLNKDPLHIALYKIMVRLLKCNPFYKGTKNDFIL